MPGNSDPTPSAQNDWRQALIRIVMVFGIVASIAWYVSYNPESIGEDKVKVLIEAPASLTLPAEGEMPLTLKVTLLNQSRVPVDLNIADPCRIFRWLVITPGDGRFVQGKLEKEDCAAVPMIATLDPGRQTSEEFTLPLDARRFSAGTYELRVEYWGTQGAHTFTVAAP
ncbi:MAG: hypothetical protein HXY22_08160 [Alphaproteobacteria bacterium]|nr:hypothetical protein [Alphaproteobacteria bacterium]